jgi:hypothetical protein
LDIDAVSESRHAVHLSRVTPANQAISRARLG